MSETAAFGRWPVWQARIGRSAWARIGVFAAALAALSLGIHGALALLGWSQAPLGSAWRIAGGFLMLAPPVLAAYLLVVLMFERRTPGELVARRALPQVAAGFLLGCALIGAVMGILWLAGSYHVRGVNPAVAWAEPLLIPGLATAVVEEIIFRGMLYRLIRDSWGVGIALATSALLFGGAHLASPGATLWTSVAIAVQAGILLGVLYQVSGSLWACIGLHMAWNFAEGAVFGGAVSGVPARNHWLQGEFSGPSWLSGGSFGIEGSVVTVALSLLLSVALMAVGARRHAHNPSITPVGPPC